MKNLKLLLLIVITIFTVNTKAQDGPNVGFYVDGIKVDSINCYEFHKKGNYVVYSIYGKDKGPIDMCIKPNQPYLLPADQANSPTKGDLQYDGAVKKGKPSDNAVLNIYLTGLTFQGEIEEFNPSCNCLQKYKKYNPIDLKKEYMLVLTNRLTGGNKERWKETDLSNPSTYSGTKVDFNNL